MGKFPARLPEPRQEIQKALQQELRLRQRKEKLELVTEIAKAKVQKRIYSEAEVEYSQGLFLGIEREKSAISRGESTEV